MNRCCCNPDKTNLEFTLIWQMTRINFSSKAHHCCSNPAESSMLSFISIFSLLDYTLMHLLINWKSLKIVVKVLHYQFLPSTTTFCLFPGPKTDVKCYPQLPRSRNIAVLRGEKMHQQNDSFNLFQELTSTKTFHAILTETWEDYTVRGSLLQFPYSWVGTERERNLCCLVPFT